MAMPLSPKSVLIRDAIKAHPNMRNKELAELINSSDDRAEDKIKVQPGDVAAQKQALKKAGELPKGRGGRKKGGGKGGRPAVAASETTTAPPAEQPRKASPTAPSASPVDLIDRVFGLAEACGGLEKLKHLVDLLAEVKAR